MPNARSAKGLNPKARRSVPKGNGFGTPLGFAVRPPDVNLAPRITDYEIQDRRLVVTFGWIDIGVVDATNGVRITLLPTILLFTIGLNQ
jgi:hypothetical protein